MLATVATLTEHANHEHNIHSTQFQEEGERGAWYQFHIICMHMHELNFPGCREDHRILSVFNPGSHCTKLLKRWISEAFSFDCVGQNGIADLFEFCEIDLVLVRDT